MTEPLHTDERQPVRPDLSSAESSPSELPTDLFSQDAMERATGAIMSRGNLLRLQVQGPQTFEDWIRAIDSAKRFVHFENYILRDDRIGRRFRELLVEKRRQGVEVRVLYDWMGCWATPRRYWKPFRQAGVEVRAFNRPSLGDPLGVFQRDHRKLVCVDGEVAYVGGLCVGAEWAGKDGKLPWRDTGIEFRGPAAAIAARAFGRIWGEVGSPLPPHIHSDLDRVVPAGPTPLWLIEGEPWRSRVYRALQLIAHSAQERIWITDPYFVAPRPVSEALIAAAEHGVDVRVLMPANNNWPWVGSLSRGGYRSLLEAGVRIFEWQGPMIHAKTAVADGVWCRVGSSNLNLSSLLGNWEMDAGVLDTALAKEMEEVFLEDLTLSVEIVLPGRSPLPGTLVLRDGRPEPVAVAEIRSSHLEPERNFPSRFEQLRGGRRAPGTASSKMARLVRAGSALGDAIAGHRQLGREDRTVLGTMSGFLLLLALLAAVFPVWMGWGVGLFFLWLGTVGGVRAFVQAKRAREEERVADIGSIDTLDRE